MPFHNILFSRDCIQGEATEQPAFLSDLNLDQIINAITASKQEYNLKPFFYASLRDIETIRYRQEVMRDLDDETLITHIKAFTERMSTVRRYMTMVEKLDSDYHKKGWFLETVLIYCDSVNTLVRDLGCADLKSRGLLAFLEYVINYVNSQEFQCLEAETQELGKAMSEVKYCVIIRSSKFKVKNYEGEMDYSIEVEKTFEKFKQGAVENYLVKLPDRTGMSHIEAKILEFVAMLNPGPFATMDLFCANHSRFMDEAIRSFDREIQFYIAYLDFIADFKREGLPFCYPTLNSTSKEEYVHDAFDLALAHASRHSEKSIVLNDFFLKDPERILIVTGPNQGGKTTFARMFGQLHYLTSLGCPVPGREARFFLFDQIFTHFEMEEDVRSLHGKLEDDLIRIHDIILSVTPDSILIVNEIFASTTLQDAVFLSKQIMAGVMELGALCVWVTFIDELSSLSEKTVSMVATVVPEDPAIRTFKIIRKLADGLAYTLSLAKKHRLTNEEIKERIK